jgi:hypothetical protein
MFALCSVTQHTQTRTLRVCTCALNRVSEVGFLHRQEVTRSRDERHNGWQVSCFLGQLEDVFIAYMLFSQWNKPTNA